MAKDIAMHTSSSPRIRAFGASRPAGFATSSTLQTRLEVPPPGRDRQTAFDWLALAWWRVSAVLTGTRGLPLKRDPLRHVRLDFVREVSDMASREVTSLQLSIESARSLRDLWHLRSTLYNIVAMRHSQQEAEARLARLNRHFPTRSPRSGLAPLDAPRSRY